MNILIIGYGSIGKRHAEILNTFTEIKQISIVTAQSCDPYFHFHCIEDVPEIMSYDYFIIANETDFHLNTLVYLDQAVKNKIILVEKPLFSDYTPFESTKNHIYVAYNLRFHPLFDHVKKHLDSQKILSLNISTGQYLPTWRPDRDYRTSYSASKKRGGGVLLDLSHEIDYFQWLCGPLSKIASIHTTISDLEIDSDDIMTLIGRSASNTICTMSIDYISKIPYRKFILQTNELTLFCDLIHNTMTFGHKHRSTQEIHFGTQDRNATYEKMHKNILFEPIKYACTLKEGLAVMSTIKTIKNSNLDTLP